MANNPNENQNGTNPSNQKGQLPKNGPSNQLHEGSQNKDNLNAGSGTHDNPDKLSMKKENGSANAGLNSDKGNEKNTTNQSGNKNG